MWKPTMECLLLCVTMCVNISDKEVCILLGVRQCANHYQQLFDVGVDYKFPPCTNLNLSAS